MTKEPQERNERRRRDMVANLTEAAEQYVVKNRTRDPKNAEDLKSIQRDAALLVEFATQISDLPPSGTSGHAALKSGLTNLVAHLEPIAFREAITELRVRFLALDQQAGMEGHGEKRTSTDRSPQSVLEWLVRLDLHRAFVEDNNLGQEFRNNRETWLALDEGFGFPVEFWSGFCVIRGS